MRTPGISKTKIIATIGPASSSLDVLARLIETGVSVFRLNFSHGTHDAHSDVLSRIRTLSRNMKRSRPEAWNRGGPLPCRRWSIL